MLYVYFSYPPVVVRFIFSSAAAAVCSLPACCLNVVVVVWRRCRHRRCCRCRLTISKYYKQANGLANEHVCVRKRDKMQVNEWATCKEHSIVNGKRHYAAFTSRMCVYVCILRTWCASAPWSWSQFPLTLLTRLSTVDKSAWTDSYFILDFLMYIFFACRNPSQSSMFSCSTVVCLRSQVNDLILAVLW